MALRLSSRPLLDTNVDAALFVDRVHEIARLRRGLNADLNCLLLGAHGSGRTSLLRHLAYVLRTQSKEPHIFVEAALVSTPQELLSLLRFRLLGDQRISAGHALTQSVQAGAQALSGAPTVSLGKPRQETEELLDLYASVKVAAERKPGCVVLIDETVDPALTHTLFGRFRDETWQLPLRWVVAGDAEARASYLAPPADAFFEIVVEVGPLSDEDAEELLMRRIDDTEVPAADLSRLVELGGGNPKRLLEHTRRLLIDGVSVDKQRANRAWLEGRLAELGPAAQKLARELDEFGPASASDKDLLERLGWSRGRAAQVFRQLEQRDLVLASAKKNPAGGPDRKVYELVRSAR